MHKLIVPLALVALAACSPPATTSSTATLTVASTTAPAAAPDTRAMADPVPASTTTGGINVIGPPPNGRTNSPLIATGTAPNTWYFEAQFRAQLISADGHVITEAPAQAQTDWTKPGTVPFMVQMPFEIAQDQQATLLLQEDMPPDADHPEHRPTREIRIPVMLSAAH